MEKRRKRKVMAVAGVSAATAGLLMTGTFAWQSISQQKVNKKVIEVNPGGRLHDDWNGKTKSVYVENFTDPDAEDSAPIFVRVRFLEYMERGNEAGVKDKEDRDAEALLADTHPGAKISDTSTWYVHIPEDVEDPFHSYWVWTTGGKTVYMPTFNKNKDSLAADINGTYDNGGGTPFGDYVLYQLSGDNSSVEGTAYYDADDNDTDEDTDLTKPGHGGTQDTHFTAVQETHTAKETLTTDAVWTMAQWKDEGSPVGNYWVWDTDGWAYWAAPVHPGTATGLLLNGVQSRNLSERTYYGINVEGQFATAGDWGTKADADQSIDAAGFYVDGITDDALDLLEKIITIQYEEGEGN